MNFACYDLFPTQLQSVSNLKIKKKRRKVGNENMSGVLRNAVCGMVKLEQQPFSLALHRVSQQCKERDGGHLFQKVNHSHVIAMFNCGELHFPVVDLCLYCRHNPGIHTLPQPQWTCPECLEPYHKQQPEIKNKQNAGRKREKNDRLPDKINHTLRD